MRTQQRASVLAAAALLGSLLGASAHAASGFGTLLSQNETTAPDSRFLGAPDDAYLGLGGKQVTYDFGVGGVINRPGAVDFNVYEVDTGTPEFSSVTVLVSVDGSSFESVSASASAVVRIVGDGTHGNNSFAKSFDLGSLGAVRYIRLDGAGIGNSGSTTGFDLDAVGVHELAAPIPEPGTWALMAAGLLAVGAAARRRPRA